MKSYKVLIILFLAVFMLASCSQPKQNVKKPTELTIEPLKLNKKEKTLISKTGVNFIEYFMLNGHLKKSEDLKIELEKYVNGKNTGETFSTSDEPEQTFHDDILSFGIQPLMEGKELNLLMGLPGGSSSSTQPINKITMSSQGNVIDKKIKLIKDSPIYLAAWVGTTKNELRGGMDDKNGKLPSVIKGSELAFVYKITLVDRNK